MAYHTGDLTEFAGCKMDFKFFAGILFQVSPENLKPTSSRRKGALVRNCHLKLLQPFAELIAEFIKTFPLVLKPKINTP